MKMMKTTKEFVKELSAKNIQIEILYETIRDYQKTILSLLSENINLKEKFKPEEKKEVAAEENGSNMQI